VHEGIIPNILKLANTIKKTALAHLVAWKPPQEPLAESWTPPAKGSFKIFLDIAIRDHSQLKQQFARITKVLSSRLALKSVHHVTLPTVKPL
jgi:hypothetical protein